MAKVYIYDEFGPEDTAMMQALYSRSAKSVTEHVEKVRSSGSGKFMEKFYVGYGHKSIADCGSTTLFIEGLSMLADKAIQDWQLYSGQETSTRYIDMSTQPIIDPVGSSVSKYILDQWMNFYIENQDHVQKHLQSKYPIRDDEDEVMYAKAIKARTFDVMRGFLPAGITTQLSWHTNLRQAYDKISLLRYHPLEEVRNIAVSMENELKRKYPNSFSHSFHNDTEKYREATVKKYNYYKPNFRDVTNFSFQTNIDVDELYQYEEVFSERPEKTNLPNFIAEFGSVRFQFLLDFGSFRDIQRHRNGVCRMPLLTTDYGFHQWYLDELPIELRSKAISLIESQIRRIDDLPINSEMRQYYVAMGFMVPCRVTYGLPAAVYTVELRSGKPVHPTLRRIAHKMHYSLINAFPLIRLHSDLDADDWEIRRGAQDIVEKAEK